VRTGRFGSACLTVYVVSEAAPRNKRLILYET
jgi:hypothetical protein